MPEPQEEIVGAMGIVDKIQLMVQWAPMLGKLELVAAAKTPQDKALAIVAALKVAADKTATAKDNDVLDYVEKILRTPEGAALVNWFSKVSQEIT